MGRAGSPLPGGEGIEARSSYALARGWHQDTGWRTKSPCAGLSGNPAKRIDPSSKQMTQPSTLPSAEGTPSSTLPRESGWPIEESVPKR
jgi:hypothetical protein